MGEQMSRTAVVHLHEAVSPNASVCLRCISLLIAPKWETLRLGQFSAV